MDREKKVDRRRKVVSDIDCFDVMDPINADNIKPEDAIVRRGTSWGNFMKLNEMETADMKIIRRYCTLRATNVKTPYGTYTIPNTNRTYGIKPITKKKDDPTRKIVLNSLDTLLARKYTDKVVNNLKRVAALKHYFITVYDVFEVAWRTKFVTYLVLENMTGDGERFRKQYAGKPEYESLLHQLSMSLLTGLQQGLFLNNLYFSDIKPENFAYSLEEDGTIKFKWIDVECISNITQGSCSTAQYLDPYNEPVDTELDVTGNTLFHSDLFKFGLSIYEMVTGSHPLEPNNIKYLNAKKRIIVIEMHRKMFAHNYPDVLPSLQHLIISLLHPDGKHRLEFCTEFINTNGVLSEKTLLALDTYKIISRIDMDNIQMWNEQQNSMFDPPPIESDSEEDDETK
jgi:hypothetical protein